MAAVDSKKDEADDAEKSEAQPQTGVLSED